ncbi:MAG: XRE family transcriptional regulator [Desulfurivibrio sp.]|nr:MAG: XRE family transcriptional regulator [Desulfurivibrio sp.]
MIEPTKIQTIYQEGVPAFVVIPFVDFAREHPAEAEHIRARAPRIPGGDAVPHEVVGLHVKEGMTYLRAWREYLGLTQAEVARKTGITQAALSQMESGEGKLRKATRQKLASAMGINLEQLEP